jgi:hypothetical protein
VPFADEPTRQVDDELLNALRNAPTAKPAPKPTLPRPSAMQPAPGRPSAIAPAIQPTIQSAMGRPSGRAPLPRPSVVQPASPDEPTRLAHVDSLAPDDLGIDHEIDHEIDRGIDDLTRPTDDFPPRFLATAPTTEPGAAFDEHPEEATRLSNLDGHAARDRPRHHGPSHGPSHDERTRAVNIRNDPSISDIDWDLD